MAQTRPLHLLLSFLLLGVVTRGVGGGISQGTMSAGSGDDTFTAHGNGRAPHAARGTHSYSSNDGYTAPVVAPPRARPPLGPRWLSSAATAYPGCLPSGDLHSAGEVVCTPGASSLTGATMNAPGPVTLQSCAFTCASGSGAFRPSTSATGYLCSNRACSGACVAGGGGCAADATVAAAGCTASGASTCSSSCSTFTYYASDPGCSASACKPTLTYAYMPGVAASPSPSPGAVNSTALVCRACTLPNSPLSDAASGFTPYVAAVNVTYGSTGAPASALMGCASGFYGGNLTRSCARESNTTADDTTGAWLPVANPTCKPCVAPAAPVGSKGTTGTLYATGGVSTGSGDPPPAAVSFACDVAGYYGGNVTYRCCGVDGTWRSGATLLNSTGTLQRPGCWGNATASQCKKCPSPPSINGTILLNVTNANGAPYTSIYTCAPGFYSSNLSIPVGPNGVQLSSRCDGFADRLASTPWTTPDPDPSTTCASCSAPDPTSNATVVSGSAVLVSPWNVAYAYTFACGTGYYGFEALRGVCCQVDGSWRVYPKLNGTTEYQNSWLRNRTRSSQCATDNTLSSATCTECPPPPLSPNVSVLDNGTISYAVPNAKRGPYNIVFSCKKGTYQTAAMSATCQQGATSSDAAWTNVTNVGTDGVASCNYCKLPALPASTYITYGPVKHPDTGGSYELGVGCSAGFTGPSNQTVYCCASDGFWRTNGCAGKDVTAVCGACPDAPLPPADATRTYIEFIGTKPTSAQYTCNSGFFGGLERLNCSSRVNATDNTTNPWGSPSLACAVCPPYPAVPGNTTVSLTYADAPVNLHPSQARYVCGEGFWGSPVTSKCQTLATTAATAWKPDAINITCTSCELPANPSGTSRYLPPTYNAYGMPMSGSWSCDSVGYFGGWNTTMRCCGSSGEWGAGADGCEATKLATFCAECPAPPPTKGIAITDVKYMNVTAKTQPYKAFGVCSKDFYYLNSTVLDTVLSASCVSSALSSAEAWTAFDVYSVCAECKAPNAPAGADASSPDFDAAGNYVVTMTCKDGYIGGNRTYTCCKEGGEWLVNCSLPMSGNASDVFCTPCPPPPFQPPNTLEPTLLNATDGDEENYYQAIWDCAPGYNGNRQASTCQSTATSASDAWSAINLGFCQSCVVPYTVPAANLSILADPAYRGSNAAGTLNATYHCQVGYFGGASTQHCCARDGKWYLGGSPSSTAGSCISPNTSSIEVDIDSYCAACKDYYPDTPKGTYRSGTYNTSGDMPYMIEYTCKPGYYNTPSAMNFTCNSNAWVNWYWTTTPIAQGGKPSTSPFKGTIWPGITSFECNNCDPPNATLGAGTIDSIRYIQEAQLDNVTYRFSCGEGWYGTPNTSFSCCMTDGLQYKDGQCGGLKLSKFCKTCPLTFITPLNVTYRFSKYASAKITPGSTLYPYEMVYGCQLGYFGFSEVTRQCNTSDGSWGAPVTTNATNYCELCPEPPADIQGGAMQMVNFVAVNATADYVCAAGTYSKSKVARCRQAALLTEDPWVYPNATAVCSRCTLPPDGDNYHVEGPVTYGFGGTPLVINVTCRDGYFGYPTNYTCCQLDGNYYTASFPDLNPNSSCSVGAEAIAALTVDTTYLHGPEDTDTSNTKAGVCRKCPQKGELYFPAGTSGVTYTVLNSAAKGLYTKLSYKCDPGFWDVRSGTLTASCNRAATSSATAWVRSGPEMYCDLCPRPGSAPVGSSNVRGQPIPAGTNCTTVFPPDPFDPVASFEAGCARGFFGAGDSKFTCCHTDGYYRDTPDGCSSATQAGIKYTDLPCSKCPDPPGAPPNVNMEVLEDITLLGVSVPVRVRYTCKDGYAGSLPVVRSCERDKQSDPWGGEVVMACTKCPDEPAAPFGANVTVVSDTAKYRCTSGYWGSPKKATCTAGSTEWTPSAIDLTCLACSIPKQPANFSVVPPLTTLPSNASSTEKLNVMCANGWYGLATKKELTCCPDNGRYYTGAYCSGVEAATLCAACPAPPPALSPRVASVYTDKGYDSISGLYSGANATYECVNGYFNNVETRTKVTCDPAATTAGATWNSTELVVAMECSACSDPTSSIQTSYPAVNRLSLRDGEGRLRASSGSGGGSASGAGFIGFMASMMGIGTPNLGVSDAGGKQSPLAMRNTNPMLASPSSAGNLAAASAAGGAAAAAGRIVMRIPSAPGAVPSPPGRGEAGSPEARWGAAPAAVPKRQSVGGPAPARVDSRGKASPLNATAAAAAAASPALLTAEKSAPSFTQVTLGTPRSSFKAGGDGSGDSPVGFAPTRRGRGPATGGSAAKSGSFVEGLKALVSPASASSMTAPPSSSPAMHVNPLSPGMPGSLHKASSGSGGFSSPKPSPRARAAIEPAATGGLVAFSPTAVRAARGTAKSSGGGGGSGRSTGSGSGSGRGTGASPNSAALLAQTYKRM